MKKRILSFLLAAILLMMAVPATVLTVFAAETEEKEYTAEDYNALYVQDRLVYAIDFMSTNAYWGGAAYSSADEGRDAGEDMLNSFAFKTYTSTNALDFNGGVREEIVKIAGGAFSTDEIYSLVVGVIDAQMNNAYGAGATMEMVSTIKSAGAKNGNTIMVNDLRFPAYLEGGKLYLKNIELQSYVVGMLDAAPRTPEGNAVEFPMDKITTFSFLMKRPADTQSYYTYDYAKQGAYFPAGIAGVSSGTSYFYVSHRAVMDGDTVVGVQQLSNDEIIASKSLFYTVKPIYTEFEGVKYITGAIDRMTLESNGQEGGEGGHVYHDPAVNPGYISILTNGDTIYENNAVAFTNNTKGGATYVRFQATGPSQDVYALRFYSRTLTDEEVLLNHAADLCKWFRLDIAGYAAFGLEDRLTMAAAIADFEFTSDRDTVAKAFNDAYNAIAYDGFTNGLEEGTTAYRNAAAFVALAIDKKLTVSQAKLLPEDLRQMLYVAVCGYANSYVTATAADIQKKLDDTVDELIDTYYGNYIDKTEYNYRDLYVKQDQLHIAADFFDAKAGDGNIYVGASYDNWVTVYNEIGAINTELTKKVGGVQNWQNLGYASFADAFRTLTKAAFSDRHADGDKFVGFSTLDEARVWARNTRTETPHANEWDTIETKGYLWKGSAAHFTTVDISDRNYPHDNVRKYGDGTLQCYLNNSLVLSGLDDASDLTYQIIGSEVGGSWQLRGFRLSLTHSAAATTITGANHYTLTVTGTQAKPVFNESGLATISIPSGQRPTVPHSYSTELTAVVDKTPNAGSAHYYKYEWDAATSKYVVTEVDGPGENVYGPVYYAGLMNLNVYGNGNLIYELDAPYQGTAPDSIGNGASNVYYAIRVYKCTLTQEEIYQNHFADLAGLYDLNLSLYYRLSESDRAALHKALRTVELGTPADVVEDVYEDVLYSYYYTFDTESDNAKTFLGLAEQYALNVESLMAISPASRERVFDIIASEPGVVAGANWFRPLLQAKLEEAVTTIRDNYFAECIGYNVASLVGYQLNLNGDRAGMRAVFALNSAIIDELNAEYAALGGLDITVGAMLLPAANAADKVTMDENGTITLPASAVASVEAYKNVPTASATREDGKYVYRLEYFPGMDAVEDDMAFVGYICLRTPKGESIVEHIYYSAGNIARGNAFSLYDLTNYAQKQYGMAHKNVQSVLNEVDGDEKSTINVGTANLSDFAIYRTDGNTYEIEALQSRIEALMGVRLRVVTDPADTDYIIYLGHADTVYYDQSDFYGIAAHGNALLLWYNDDANQGAMLEVLDAIFDLAASSEDVYTIHNGTSYVYRSHN